jgi:hypothetical protein
VSELNRFLQKTVKSAIQANDTARKYQSSKNIRSAILSPVIWYYKRKFASSSHQGSINLYLRGGKKVGTLCGPGGRSFRTFCHNLSIHSPRDSYFYERHYSSVVKVFPGQDRVVNIYDLSPTGWNWKMNPPLRMRIIKMYIRSLYSLSYRIIHTYMEGIDSRIDRVNCEDWIISISRRRLRAIGDCWQD